MNVNDCIKDILVSEEEIDSITSSLAEKITEDYKDSEKELILLCVLKGSIVFTSDLIKKIQIPLEVETMKVSSYADSTVSSGVIKIQLDLCRDDLSKVDILIVEDIVDSGRTLSYLMEMLRDRGPASMRLCTLLDKPDRRVVQVPVDYTGFQIPDEFVVGYGLDYAQKYRNLPYIGIVSFDE